MSKPSSRVPADDATATREAIRAEALALGFDACGFARAETNPAARVDLAQYLAQGRHMDMAWMAETAERRADPRVLWPEARTAVVVAMNYGPTDDPMAPRAAPDRGAISVYARGRDYHDVMKKRLKALARWLVAAHGGEVKVFVDTAPLMEKPLAAVAGLGWQGKHTNLVSRRFGSWLLLGELLTTLELPPDRPEADHCGSCDRCRAACPTGALDEPWRMDTGRCISYLTIEAKGPVPDDLRRLIGNRIYGCDDCLAVCPWNKFATPAGEPALQGRAELAGPPLAALAALDDAAFRALFAGSPVKRTGRDRFVANVAIALGNGGDPGMRAVLDRLAADPSERVRDAARWALGRLRPETAA